MFCLIEARTALVSSFFIGLIRFYQRYISAALPPTCRFEPTCSNYTTTAIERFGSIRGVFMGVWRILKCHPFHPGGLDPVPEREE